MEKIILDGRYMLNKDLAHLYIKFQLNSNVYYGNNLDALWDVLSTYSQPLLISIINKDKLLGNLGQYGEYLIKVFEDAKEDNKYIELEIV